MISTILLMTIHDLVLVSVVVTNCSLGHGLEVMVSEHYLRNTHFVQDGERVFQNKFKIMVSPACFKNTKVLKLDTKCEWHCAADTATGPVSSGAGLHRCMVWAPSGRDIVGPVLVRFMMTSLYGEALPIHSLHAGLPLGIYQQTWRTCYYRSNSCMVHAPLPPSIPPIAPPPSIPPSIPPPPLIPIPQSLACPSFPPSIDPSLPLSSLDWSLAPPPSLPSIPIPPPRSILPSPPSIPPSPLDPSLARPPSISPSIPLWRSLPHLDQSFSLPRSPSFLPRSPPSLPLPLASPPCLLSLPLPRSPLPLNQSFALRPSLPLIFDCLKH